MHRSVAFQFVLVAFLAGVAVSSFVPVPTWTVWSAMAVAGVAAMTGRTGIIVGMCLVSVSYGMYLTQRALDDGTALHGLVGQEIVMIGYVDGDFEPTTGGGQFVFRDVATDERVLVVQASWPRWRYGQYLQLSGVLKAPENFGAFDYVSFLRKEGIRTVIRYPRAQEVADIGIAVPTRAWLALRGGLYRVRDAVAASLSRSVGEPTAAYLTGILVGARQSIPRELTDAFAVTGTSHILAISGYNITIVAQMIMLGLLRLMPRRRALLWALGAIILFTLLVGAGASVVRAALMGSLVFIAGNLGRMASPAGAILVSATIMTLINPLLLRYDIGFQLSFLAVSGLIYLEPVFQRLWGTAAKPPGMASVLIATLSAQMATLPLILYYFGTLSVYALPVNMLVLPLVPLAMGMGLATGLAGLVLPLAGRVIGAVAWTVATYQLGIVRWFARLPYAALSVRISAGTLVALYAVLAGWYLIYGRKKAATV